MYTSKVFLLILLVWSLLPSALVCASSIGKNQNNTMNQKTINQEQFKISEEQEKILQEADMDYTQIQTIIDDVLSSKESFSFSDYVSGMLERGEAFAPRNIIDGVLQGIRSEFKANIHTFAKLIAIGIIAAIFTNFASVFMDNQVAETGFYITYIILFGILISSFRTASHLSSQTVDHVLQFMKVLVPSFFLAITFSTGSATSLAFYEVTLIVIMLVNYILIHFIIPAVNIYLIIMLANNLSKEDRLSKFAETIATIIRWILRSLIVLVVGFSAIQALIAPVADSVKRSVFMKAGGAIPGIGNLLSGVTETVIGAGVLLKNAIGVAGLVVIIIICAIPILKLVVCFLIYRISEAMVQPISDKRILNCMSACSEGVNLLLQVVIVTAILFLITLTIITASTSMM